VERLALLGDGFAMNDQNTSPSIDAHATFDDATRCVATVLFPAPTGPERMTIDPWSLSFVGMDARSTKTFFHLCAPEAVACLGKFPAYRS
jgi:hypothetical protein